MDKQVTLNTIKEYLDEFVKMGVIREVKIKRQPVNDKGEKQIVTKSLSGEDAYEVRSCAGKSCFILKSQEEAKNQMYFFESYKGTGYLSSVEELKQVLNNAMTDIKFLDCKGKNFPLVIFEFFEGNYSPRDVLDFLGYAKYDDVLTEYKRYEGDQTDKEFKVSYKELVRTTPITSTIEFSEEISKGYDLPIKGQTMASYIKDIKLTEDLKNTLSSLVVDFDKRTKGVGAHAGQNTRLFRNFFRILDLEMLLNNNKDNKNTSKIVKILDFSMLLMGFEKGVRIKSHKEYLEKFAMLLGEQCGKIANSSLVHHNHLHRQDITLAAEICDLDIVKTREKAGTAGYYLQVLSFAGHLKPLIDSVNLVGKISVKDEEILNIFKQSFIEQIKDSPQIEQEFNEQFKKEIFKYYNRYKINEDKQENNPAPIIYEYNKKSKSMDLLDEYDNFYQNVALIFGAEKPKYLNINEETSKTRDGMEMGNITIKYKTPERTR